MYIWFMIERFVTRLFSSLRTFGFLFGYLPVSLPRLRKVKEQKGKLSTEEYDKLVHAVPQMWAEGILERTKSTFEVKGLENLPEGPVLLISNHEGNFDIPTLLTYIPKPFGFISKVEVKKLPIIRTWMEEMNCVFLDRSSRKSSYQSILDTIEQLKNGHSILIFPEGTRSKGQGLGEFKSGFMRIAKEAQVPIVPIAIKGTSEIMEKNNNKIRPAHVQISILPTYSSTEVVGTNSKDMIQLIQQRIERELHLMNNSN